MYFNILFKFKAFKNFGQYCWYSKSTLSRRFVQQGATLDHKLQVFQSSLDFSKESFCCCCLLSQLTLTYESFEHEKAA